MAQDQVTKDLITQYRVRRLSAVDALVEVLCSAYKDATFSHPDDRMREALLEAISNNTP